MTDKIETLIKTLSLQNAIIELFKIGDTKGIAVLEDMVAELRKNIDD